MLVTVLVVFTVHSAACLEQYAVSCVLFFLIPCLLLLQLSEVGNSLLYPEHLQLCSTAKHVFSLFTLWFYMMCVFSSMLFISPGQGVAIVFFIS